MTTEERELVERLRTVKPDWCVWPVGAGCVPVGEISEAAAYLIERIAKERDEAIDALLVKSREFHEYKKHAELSSS